MMDFTWYIMGALTGAVAYALYLISRKAALNWLSWSGLMIGSSLILFSIAWAVGSDRYSRGCRGPPGVNAGW